LATESAGRDEPVGVPAVHRVGARREGLALAAAVGGVAGVLPVDDVRGDREDGLRVLGVAVGGQPAELLHERPHQVHRDLVHAVVVVAEGGEVALHLVVHHEPGLVPDGPDDGVLDRREAVGHDGEPGDAEGHGPLRVVVVEGHLDPLVGVLVVHVVDAVHRIHVHVRQPVHRPVEPGGHLVVVEDVAGTGSESGAICSPLTSSRPPLMA
jgi:hypothetical protein